MKLGIEIMFSLVRGCLPIIIGLVTFASLLFTAEITAQDVSLVLGQSSIASRHGQCRSTPRLPTSTLLGTNEICGGQLFNRLLSYLWTYSRQDKSVLHPSTG